MEKKLSGDDDSDRDKQGNGSDRRPLLRLRRASWMRGAAQAHRVSFAVHAGELVVLIGPNAAGKSTFAGVIVGTIPLTDGERFPCRTELVSVAPETATVDETLGAEHPESRRALAEHYGIAQGHVAELSSGERWRLALARASISTADVVVLDNPTSDLDSAGRDLFHETVRRLTRLGKGVVVCTHDPEVIFEHETASLYRVEFTGPVLVRRGRSA